MKAYYILFFLVLNFALFTSCSNGNDKKNIKPVEIKGDKQNSLLKIADPITDDILKGYNKYDYQLYSKHFDENMKNALPENVFNQTTKLIKSKLGSYKSRSFNKILKQGSYFKVYYIAVFEKEEKVIIKVVLQKYDDKYLVSGLWYDSEKLRN